MHLHKIPKINKRLPVPSVSLASAKIKLVVCTFHVSCMGHVNFIISELTRGISLLYFYAFSCHLHDVMVALNNVLLRQYNTDFHAIN